MLRIDANNYGDSSGIFNFMGATPADSGENTATTTFARMMPPLGDNGWKAMEIFGSVSVHDAINSLGVTATSERFKLSINPNGADSLTLKGLSVTLDGAALLTTAGGNVSQLSVNSRPVIVNQPGAANTGSFALGSGSITTKDYAVALGPNTTAAGWGSFSSGSETKSYGAGSTAGGWGSVAGDPAHPADYGDWGNGYAATALGEYSNAKAQGSTALGRYSSALGMGSFAVGGWDNQSHGYASIAMGHSSRALGGISFASGHAATAQGQESFAIGRGTYSNGFASFAGGWGSIAGGETYDPTQQNPYEPTSIGVTAFAFGQSTKATGRSSVSMGQGNDAKGPVSMAIGLNNLAPAPGAVALGWVNIASGHASTGIGHQNNAQSYGSVALGLENKAWRPGQTTVGRWSKQPESVNVNNTTGSGTDEVFVVGGGVSESTRKNAMVVTADGDIKALGGAQLSGNLSVNGAAIFNQPVILQGAAVAGDIPMYNE